MLAPKNQNNFGSLSRRLVSLLQWDCPSSKKKMYETFFLAKLFLIATLIVEATKSIEVKPFLKMEIVNSGFHR